MPLCSKVARLLLIVLGLALGLQGTFQSFAAEAATEALAMPSRLDELVPALMVKHRVPGVSIVGIEQRRIAWSRQYGVMRAGDPNPVTSETLFEAASMSKPLGAYVAMKLVEQGKLDLDRPLYEYLGRPYLPDQPLHLMITARMVLSHTSGFPNWRADGPLRVVSVPGTKFTYSGEGFTYLQRVIERITGESFETYIKQALLDPLDMTTGGYSWRESFGILAAAGHDGNGEALPRRKLFIKANMAYSFYSSPTEYAQFLIEMMKEDRSAPHSLNAESIELMLTPMTRTRTSTVHRDGSRSESSHYGLGWAIDLTTNGKRIRHSGSNTSGFRSYCEFYPQRGSGIVIMTNATGGSALWREIIEAIGEP